MAAILAKKLGMTQLFVEDGRVERVTVLEAGPCPVTAIRTFERDGYEAVQLAFGATKEKQLTKAELGHLAKADAPPMRHVVEFRGEAGELLVGETVTVEAFEAGDRGQGLRHLQGQGLPGHDQAPQLQPRPRRHGSHNVRAPGSIGASATPVARLQGHPRPGPDGQQARDAAGPRGRRASTPTRTCCSSAARSPGRATATWRCAPMADAPVLGGDEEGRRSTTTAFGARFNGPLVHESVRAELTARRGAPPRRRRAATVSGGGAKPWRQKGTGRARAGSSRSPIFTGGGTVFGPTPRHYTFKVNRKERRAALRSALSLHAERGSLAVLDPAPFDAPSTKRPRRCSPTGAAARLDAGGPGRAEERERRPVVPQHRARRRVLPATDVGVADIVGAAASLVSEAALERSPRGQGRATATGRRRRR